MEEKANGQDNILYIKNMVCRRCIMAVENVLTRHGLHPVSVDLGTASVEEKITPELKESLAASLEAIGFELMDDRKSRLIEQIRSEVIKLVHYSGDAARTNLSDYLSSRLNRDYGYLSRLFSEISGTTIEKYFIAQKIERAKELLAYGELSLGEIADELGYSSAAYFSSQFKSVTGLTPSHFRTMKGSRRKAIDKV